MARLIFLLLLLTTLQQAATGKVTLPDIIGTNMVLQRDQQVPIWGNADPGEAVQVEFKSQNRSTVADENGRWKVLLGPFSASDEPASMRIHGSNTILLDNILVGEVWLCSGQSNMQWTLHQSDGGEQAIAAADHVQIRLFNVSREVAFGREDGVLAEWQVCSPATGSDFSGVGYFFGLQLYRSLNIPIGLINSSYGGSQAEAWTPREYLAASEDLIPCIEREEIWKKERDVTEVEYAKAIADWETATERAKAAGERPPRKPRVPDALRDYRIASSIYTRMIEPLIPYGMRGVLWYQGESNEDRAEQYAILLPTMIRSWRERWGQGDFPFAIVQLPNFRDASDVPADQAWSHLRDAQRLTSLDVPNTGLIVTIDIGESDDIHPGNKLDVGKRLHQWVMADVYDADITGSGPVFSEATFKKGKAILTFKEVGAGLRTSDGGALQEFALAGNDNEWRWAQARITGKSRVEVWSDEVDNPVAVRYAFNNNPVNPNLTNETGIPASPFRTDDWPGPTHGKR